MSYVWLHDLPRGVTAQFVDGPLDGMTYTLAPVPGPVDRVVLVEPPAGPRTLIYGPNLRSLPAPIAGESAQHVYEPAGYAEDPHPLRMAVPPAIRFRYRGPFPADVAPYGRGPHYVGPVRIVCHGGRVSAAGEDDGPCLIPTGLTALELGEEDATELDVIERAHACPNLGCGRLFLIAPTTEDER